MEQNLVYDSFDADECGVDEFDDSGFVVEPIHIFGMDWLGEAAVGYFVSFDEALIKAID